MDIKLEVQEHQFPNFGYILARLPDEYLLELRKISNSIQADPTAWAGKEANAGLAGHLKQEYNIELSHDFQLFLEGVAKGYRQSTTPNKDITTKLISTWINMQRKYEFNPPHRHEGRISFVIWVNIPYDLEEELSYFPNARDKRTSQFEFIYQSTTGAICSQFLPISKEWEGTICMFPADMLHMVNPFYTSDGIRVSVSGNLQ